MSEATAEPARVQVLQTKRDRWSAQRVTTLREENAAAKQKAVKKAGATEKQ